MRETRSSVQTERIVDRLFSQLLAQTISAGNWTEEPESRIAGSEAAPACDWLPRRLGGRTDFPPSPIPIPILPPALSMIHHFPINYFSSVIRRKRDSRPTVSCEGSSHAASDTDTDTPTHQHAATGDTRIRRLRRLLRLFRNFSRPRVYRAPRSLAIILLPIVCVKMQSQPGRLSSQKGNDT